MYPAEIVMPMKAELTDNGFEELVTPQEVDDAVERSKCQSHKFHLGDCEASDPAC